MNKYYQNAPVAWEVEDGDGLIGVENPPTLTSIGEAILNMWSPEQFLEIAKDVYGNEFNWGDWDFSDPVQVVDFVTWPRDCVWHVPTDVYESADEAAWVEHSGRFLRNQPLAAVAPEGYTRVVWVQL